MSQTLRGFVGQSMNGDRPAFAARAAAYGPGTFTFRFPVGGRHRIVLRGSGAQADGSAYSGGSGAYVETTRVFGVNASVVFVVQQVGSGLTTTATFSDSTVLSAGGANAPASGVTQSIGGVASITGITTISDVLYAGSDGHTTGSQVGRNGLGPGGGAGGINNGVASGGAGAPGTIDFPGAPGAGVGSVGGTGAGGQNSNVASGDAMAFVYRV